MTATNDALERFVSAQEHNYSQALSELKNGQKRTHWMWYIFPQVAGLGLSATAQKYSIKDKNEAIAYLHHNILGPRLRECTQAVLDIDNQSATSIFGYPDNLKLCSCMTLFESVSDANSEFSRVLEKFYHGERDAITLEKLEQMG